MDDCLTVEEAYRAMHHFVKEYWERGGKEGRELLLFLTYADPRYPPMHDNPVGSDDPAAWSDWLRSVGSVRSQK